MTNEAAERLRIDPTMHVYCRIHSEQTGHDGGRRGPVAATFGKDEWGRYGYDCWHCARQRILDAEAER
jgi:hypothetical protein